MMTKYLRLIVFFLFQKEFLIFLQSKCKKKLFVCKTALMQDRNDKGISD